MTGYEKLGAFYLGRQYDLAQGKGTDAPLLYDSKDLVTHAVCVGMTGSGKTGLCISLLEEAAIDGIPALIIDPKGDLANLLLQFPDLSPQQFAPWVNPDEAAKKGLPVAGYAAQQAQLWKDGLARWGQGADRVAKLQQSADFTIYTPGSSAGIPVSVLKSFACPPDAVLNDREACSDKVQASAMALLALAGIEAGPIQSRQHVLLSTLIHNAWQQGKDLDLASLIQQVQAPPVTRIGVLDIEAFYPAKERFALAMAINNLIAAPGFELWMEGEPLDIGRMLYAAGGRPRHSIFSIAHLSDAERMFFVSLLLNETLAWARAQEGTTSLRAILYMDEIFGYFPPVADPPSKKPLLTLLKQGRAFGLGVVLATQNPVDLDYKGLANAGTWFIGRLQTGRDKQRVIEGLEGAAATAGAGFDRQRMEHTLAGLGSRIFLMNNVHDDAPVVFETRWALSYLRGPLTRQQIRQLMEHRRDAGQAPSTPSATKPLNPQAARPVLAPGVEQRFAPVRSAGEVVYQPMLLGAAQVLFSDARRKVNHAREVIVSTGINDGVVPVDWQQCETCEINLDDLEAAPAEGASFDTLPPAAAQARNYKAWEKDFANWLYSTQELVLFKSPSTGEVSSPGEIERDFRLHLQQRARESRDEAVVRLRQKFAPKINALEDRIHRAHQAVDREKTQASTAKMDTALSIGVSLLGTFLGGGRRSGVSASKVGTAMRSASRSYSQGQDVGRAEENRDRLQQQLSDLEAELEQEVSLLQSATDPLTEALETISIRPRKTNITVRLVALVWRG